MTRPLRLAFMGTPDFSVPTLAALLKAGHNVVAVYSQPPRPAGRGKKLRPSPVQAFAEKHDIPVFTPLSLKQPAEQQAFADLNLDCAVVVAYGLILPQAILDAPKHGCLNVHASLLPRWRGAAPIHRAIMAGDKETGVDIMQMEAGLDTGPVLLEKKITIQPGDTTGILHERLADLGAKAIIPALDGWTNGSITARPQAEEGIIYAHKIDKAEAHIDWGKSAEVIRNQIHGLSPFPGAWTTMGGERLKIHKAEVVETSTEAPPGTIIDTPLTIQTGAGALRLISLQRAGKGAMDAEEFLRGFPLEKGAVFD
ncbi:MAG: methionyl-tRNA formyltransferase [Kordiimonas sp.]|nr:methionyl-tRNA formyltransferase [Kordiimonas sp.]